MTVSSYYITSNWGESAYSHSPEHVSAGTELLRFSIQHKLSLIKSYYQGKVHLYTLPQWLIIYLVMFPRSLFLLLSLLCCCSLTNRTHRLHQPAAALFVTALWASGLSKLAAEYTLKIKQSHLLLSWGSTSEALKREEWLSARRAGTEQPRRPTRSRPWLRVAHPQVPPCPGWPHIHEAVAWDLQYFGLSHCVVWLSITWYNSSVCKRERGGTKYVSKLSINSIIYYLTYTDFRSRTIPNYQSRW